MTSTGLTKYNWEKQVCTGHNNLSTQNLPSYLRTYSTGFKNIQIEPETFINIMTILKTHLVPKFKNHCKSEEIRRKP